MQLSTPKLSNFIAVKKFIVLLTLMIYLASTNGMVKSIHFCMDKVVNTQLGFVTIHQEKCKLCGMKTTDNGCCSDEQSVIKMASSHQASFVEFYFPACYFPPSDLFPLRRVYVEPNKLARTVSLGVSSPPVVPKYIRYCSFLI